MPGSHGRQESLSRRNVHSFIAATRGEHIDVTSFLVSCLNQALPSYSLTLWQQLTKIVEEIAANNIPSIPGVPASLMKELPRLINNIEGLIALSEMEVLFFDPQLRNTFSKRFLYFLGILLEAGNYLYANFIWKSQTSDNLTKLTKIEHLENLS